MSSEGELATYWKVLEADLRQDFKGTTGSLKVQNVSNAPLEDAVLYAEYLDSTGRLCFSLLFKQGEDQDKQSTITPGGIGVMGSGSAGIFPVAEPKEVRLFLVQLRLPQNGNSLRNWDVRFRVPVTIVGGARSTLQLDTELASARAPVIDLLLSNVSVNRAGVVTKVDVIHSASSRVESWFRDFVQRQATLFPATDRDVPQEAEALILVRAVWVDLKEGELQKLLVSPSTSPWVRVFLKDYADDPSVPLTELVFVRPTNQVNRLTSTGETEVTMRPPASPNLLELAFQDSYWSSPAVGWVKDDSMPHHMRREIAKAQPQ